MNEIQSARTADTIGAEIRHITYQAKCMTLLYGVEIGRRLKEAKKLVPYGAFGDWLKAETEFSHATATRFMKLFDEYGGELFAANAEFSTLQKVSVSNALRLLALPADEREEFAKENDVERKSARELDELIKQRDEALAEANEERMRALALEEKAKEAEGGVAEAIEQIQKLNAENKELRERPIDVAVAVDEEAIAQAAADAKAKADAEWSERLKAVRKDKELAQGDAEKLRDQVSKLKKEIARVQNEPAVDVAPYEQKIQTLEKQLALSDAAVTTFKVLFADWQTAFNRMLEALQATPEESRQKLNAAAKAVLDGQVGRL